VQLVTTAWRVYYSDNDLTNVADPLDVLRAFVDRYGLTFTVGADPQERKFILYETIPLPKDAQTDLLKLHNKAGQKFEASNLFRVRDGVAEVAIVYAIDIDRYAEDLRKHGVNVEPLPANIVSVTR